MTPSQTAPSTAAGDAQDPSTTPALLMIGLGRMGGNMARRLAGAGVQVHGHDRGTADPAVAEAGVRLHEDLAQAVAALPAHRTRVVWLMLPHGPATDSTVAALQPLLRAGDLIVDGGNANYLTAAAVNGSARRLLPR